MSTTLSPAAIFPLSLLVTCASAVAIYRSCLLTMPSVNVCRGVLYRLRCRRRGAAAAHRHPHPARWGRGAARHSLHFAAAGQSTIVLLLMCLNHSWTHSPGPLHTAHQVTSAQAIVCRDTPLHSAVKMLLSASQVGVETGPLQVFPQLLLPIAPITCTVTSPSSLS